MWAKPLFLLVLMLVVCVPSPGAETENEPATRDPALEALILQQVELLSDGPATYTGTSAVVEESTSGDQVAALFTMSDWAGGNGTRQYLAVFSKNDEELWQLFTKGRRSFRRYTLEAIVPVGYSSWRFFDSATFEESTIRLRGKTWAKDDAHCCPSVPTSTKYVLDQRGLVEVKGSEK